MKNLLLLSLFLLFSCQTTKKYLKSNGIDCDCTAIILEMQNIFYKIDEEKKLYSIHFESSEKKEQVFEYVELLKKYTFVANNAAQKCMQKLNRKMIEKIFGTPTNRQTRQYTYRLVHPKCKKPFYEDGTPCDARGISYFAFGFYDNGKVKWLELDSVAVWLQI